MLPVALAHIQISGFPVVEVPVITAFDRYLDHGVVYNSIEMSMSRPTAQLNYRQSGISIAGTSHKQTDAVGLSGRRGCCNRTLVSLQ